MFITLSFFVGDFVNLKNKYISSAFLLLLSGIAVKLISAVYKIPLTSYIGAVGRGYFAYAYNLVMPVHIVTMGAFPVALSKLVSSYAAKNDFQSVAKLKKSSTKVFFLVGSVSTVILIACAFVYNYYIVKAPQGIYTSLALIPAVLLSCMSGGIRGYYEGMLDMKPTSISQFIEALVKMIFGLLFAKLACVGLMNEYESSNTVLGHFAENEQTALSMIYPVSSAAAMLGVTLGAALSLCFLWTYSAFFKNNLPSVKASKQYSREILRFAFPIMVSSGVQSVFQFLDSSSIQILLDKTPLPMLKSEFSDALKLTAVIDSDLSTYAYGLHSCALDFKNLIPGVTMALGVCAVPVISRAFDNSDKERLETLASSILKYTAVLSSLGGLALFLCSNDILSFLYSSSPDVSPAIDKIVKAYAVSVPVYSIAGTAVFFVQAIGMPQKSILPYAVCGVMRVALNYILMSKTSLLLFAPVISGAVGYLVLALLNLRVFKAKAALRLRLFSCVAAPILLAFVAGFVCNYAFEAAFIIQNGVVSCLTKCVFCSIIYLILCFLCRLLKFSDFFRYFNHKKIPETLANTD